MECLRCSVRSGRLTLQHRLVIEFDSQCDVSVHFRRSLVITRDTPRKVSTYILSVLLQLYSVEYGVLLPLLLVIVLDSNMMQVWGLLVRVKGTNV